MSAQRKSIPPKVPGDLLGHLTIALKALKGSIIARSRSHLVSGKVHMWGGDVEDLDKSNTIQYELRGSWNIIQQYFLDAGSVPLYIVSCNRGITSNHETTLGHVSLMIPFDSLQQALTSNARKSSMIVDAPLISASQHKIPYTVQVEISLTLAQPHFHLQLMPGSKIIENPSNYVHSPWTKFDSESLCTEDDSIFIEAVGLKPTAMSKEYSEGFNVIYGNFIESKDLYDGHYPIENLDIGWDMNSSGRVKRITPEMKQELNLVERKAQQKFCTRNSEKINQTERKDQTNKKTNKYNLDPSLSGYVWKSMESNSIKTEASVIQKWWRNHIARGNRRALVHRSATIIQKLWQRTIKRNRLQGILKAVNIYSTSHRGSTIESHDSIHEFFISFNEVSGIRELLLVQDISTSQMFDPGLMISFSYPSQEMSNFSTGILKTNSFNRSIVNLKLHITGRCVVCHPEDWCHSYIWLVPIVQKKMMSKYPSKNTYMEDIPPTAVKLCYFKFPLISLSDSDEHARQYKCPLLINGKFFSEKEISIGGLRVTVGFCRDNYNDQIIDEVIDLTSPSNEDLLDDKMKYEPLKVISSECQTEDFCKIVSSECQTENSHENIQEFYERTKHKSVLDEDIVISRSPDLSETVQEIYMDELMPSSTKVDLFESAYFNDYRSTSNLSNMMDSLDKLNESLIGLVSDKTEEPTKSQSSELARMDTIPSTKVEESEILHLAEAKAFHYNHAIKFNDSKSVYFGKVLVDRSNMKESPAIAVSKSRKIESENKNDNIMNSTTSDSFSDDLKDLSSDSLSHESKGQEQKNNIDMHSTSSDSTDEYHLDREPKWNLELSSDSSDSSF